MVDVINYDFKSITYRTVKPEESFINLYVDEDLESENAIKSTHRIRRTLDVKYKKFDLNGVMTKQCQKNLTDTEHHAILQLLKKFDDIFDCTLDTWNSTPVDLELKDNAKPVCLRPYPVPKVHKTMFKK